ncbi:hypothetical protein DPMN_101421 [Dreissena polymorpha]|uniref:Uncharacterized protein n=1 Tax=Dreissena polymorpha TaxID=45954 RepID=A0A9D4LIQ5_DREPO|nr:hypothetical protein DPMN_101421 [Dreissena polymorpha]
MVSVRKTRDTDRQYGVGGKCIRHRQTICCRRERHGTPADDMLSVRKAGDTDRRYGVDEKGMRHRQTKWRRLKGMGQRQTIWCRWEGHDTSANDMVSLGMA